MTSLSKTIAVAYIARGADNDWLLSCERFLDSYIDNPSGINHSLYVLFKGFSHKADLEKAKNIFKNVSFTPVFLGDDNFDIGAYIEWATMIEEELICVLNTASEILTPNWLRKLALNLAIPHVGLVGATASYESLNELNVDFPDFPNSHIRSTAFMICRELFVNITEGLEITRKVDAYHFESGPKSLTNEVLATGKIILLVGRNGRGYLPEFWPTSDTFRQGAQKNLLVADTQTRNYLALPWSEKMESVVSTWGPYIKNKKLKKRVLI